MSCTDDKKQLEESDDTVGSKNNKVKNDTSKGQENGLWCSQCIDDSRIPICCFCGCKVRFILD